MPELPEVETIARGVHERVAGDRIVQVWFSGHSEPFKTAPSRQAVGLEGLVFVSIHRTGKHIVCELARTPGSESTAQWIVHLGMTGRLLVTTPDAPVAAHTHARLTLKSGRELRFVDPRRFGRLEFRELGGDGNHDYKHDPNLDPSADPPFLAPGADPLTIGKEEFVALFRGRHLAIKAALLNQSLLAGVGNIYADESLFAAGIRPRRSAGRLTKAELDRLRQSLKRILRHAIQLGGSSVSDYVDANGVRGFFQLEHRVYMRTGQPCRVCGTAIRRILIAGRGTHYCPKCQH